MPNLGAMKYVVSSPAMIVVTSTPVACIWPLLVIVVTD